MPPCIPIAQPCLRRQASQNTVHPRHLGTMRCPSVSCGSGANPDARCRSPHRVRVRTATVEQLIARNRAESFVLRRGSRLSAHDIRNTCSYTMIAGGCHAYCPRHACTLCHRPVRARHHHPYCSHLHTSTGTLCRIQSSALSQSQWRDGHT